MRILQIGMLLPETPMSGEDSHIKALATELIKQGHSVDVLTVIPSNQVQTSFIQKDGINYYILQKPKPYMYHSVLNPINEVYDDFDNMLFYQILKQLGHYDVIHIHSMYPLSVAEIAKKFTDRLIHTMHGTYTINPLMHTFSGVKINENPLGCLAQDKFDAERFTEEYLEMSNYEFKDYKDMIYKQMKERLEYGKYLLEEVYDLVVSNGYFGLHAYLDFGVKPTKIRFIEFPVNNNLSEEVINEAKERYDKDYDKYVYAYLSNWQYMKGQHTFAMAFTKTKSNNIEGRLYGEMNINPQYKQLIADIILKNNLKQKVKLKGKYTKDEMKEFTKELFMHVNTQAWGLGQTGTFYETLMQYGIMQIFTPSKHLDAENEFKDKYYFENTVTDENLYSLYEFELKHNPKPDYELKKLYEELSDYIFDCGDYETLAKRIDNSVGKNHFDAWHKLAKERARRVNYDFNTYLKYIYLI
jgi:hypothetical protein